MNIEKKSFLALLILFAALSRLLPHVPNFTPVIAIGIFAGTVFENKRVGMLAALSAMVISDIFIGFHSQMFLVYLSLVIIVLASGSFLREIKALPLLGAVTGGSLFFFVLTNFGVWLFDAMYPKTFAGLVACFVAGIPFIAPEFLGTLFYSALLFGAYAFFEKRLFASSEIRKTAY